ncbi:MAG: hypothetical protein D0528_11000 [Methylococcales bacterium]|nr:MAG: hypothetical protein D0528_11000 [Methylococcales bacterium]
MPSKTIVILFWVSATTLLMGCNFSNDSCSSSETEQLFYNQLSEQALNLTSKKREDYYDGAMIFGATKVRELLGLIHFELENIKTIRQGSENHQSLCTGMLKISVPPPMLSNVNLSRKAQNQLHIAQYAKQLSINNSLNVFSQNVNYSVKSTGDVKKPHIEFESSAWIHLLDEITTAALLKPTLDIHDLNRIDQNPQATHIVEPINTQEKPIEPEDKKEDKKEDKENEALITADSLEKEIMIEPPKKQEPIQPVQPSSPGFDCSKATKPTDVTICEQSSLAILDNQNMSIYKKAKTIDPVATKEVWKDSIKYKYACGTDVDCIADIYKKSIQRYTCIANQKNCVNVAPF